MKNFSAITAFDNNQSAVPKIILRADWRPFRHGPRQRRGEKAGSSQRVAGRARMSEPGCLEAGAPLVSQRGLGVIEIVVAVGIISTVFFGVYQFALTASTSVHASARQVEAAYLAQEGLEAVRTLRDKSWDTNIVPVSVGTVYYPTIVSGSWTLSTTNPGLIDNLFTRTITLQDVLRDSDDNIATSGTVDPDTKKITATVSWSEKTGTRQVVIETYITNFLQN